MIEALQANNCWFGSVAEWNKVLHFPSERLVVRLAFQKSPRQLKISDPRKTFKQTLPRSFKHQKPKQESLRALGTS